MRAGFSALLGRHARRLLLGALAAAALPTACIRTPAADAVAAAVPYDPRTPFPAAPDVTLLAAFELQGGDRRFGGISAVLADGPDLLLLSDRSVLFKARRALGPGGAITGLDEWRAVPLTGFGLHPDTEALTRTGGGRLAVGLEGTDRLAWLEGDALTAGPKLPRALAALPGNEGIEALTGTGEGDALLAFGEGVDADGRHPVALIGAAAPWGGSVAVPDGFVPVDAALAGDRLFLLERRASLLGGLAARIVAFPAGMRLTDVTTATPHRVLEIDGGGWSENYEGLAVERRGPDYLLTVVSDDNFNPLLRTLLLRLRWSPGD